MDVEVPDLSSVTDTEEAITTNYQLVSVPITNFGQATNPGDTVLGQLYGGSVTVNAPSGTSILGGGVALRNDSYYFVTMHTDAVSDYNTNTGAAGFANGPVSATEWLFSADLAVHSRQPSVNTPPAFDGNWGTVYITVASM